MAHQVKIAGTIGAEMINSLCKSKWLPNYDNDKCNKVIEEINDLSKMIKENIEANIEINNKYGSCLQLSKECDVTNCVNYYSIERNRRILMAYHRYRMNKIEDIRWLKGGILNKQYKKKLSDEEIEYFKNYSKLLNSYMKSIGVTITAHLSPPKEIKKEFIIRENIGTLITDDGIKHNFLENVNRIFMPANQHTVEMLCQNNKIEQINDQ